MSTRPNTDTPRSASRSKRSTTNLSNLRLAPLSEKFVEPTPKATPQTPRTTHPSDSPAGSPYARYHSSYIHGQSAPTTPGILSRRSSRKHLGGGGLSRRNSLYNDATDADTPTEYAYAPLTAPHQQHAKTLNPREPPIPQSKSDAALILQQRLAASRSPVRKRHVPKSRTNGSATPRSQRRAADLDGEWLTRTGAATNAILQESKGQSWIASRASSTSLAPAAAGLDSEDDEGYEEMAAKGSRGLRFADDEERGLSVSAREGVRVGASKWGSRYGSRQGSRRGSRRGSLTGLRTPGTAAAVGGGGGYFDVASAGRAGEESEDEEFEDAEDEAELARYTDGGARGLGGLVDRLIGFNAFTLEDQADASASDAEAGAEAETARLKRREAEARRRKEEKEQLLVARNAARRDEGIAEQQDEGGWRDAAWLLSVASRAMFAD
ncbi:hypothetical protein MBLNU230_g5701t1 [Neophaeotheca triangularis]